MWCSQCHIYRYTKTDLFNLLVLSSAVSKDRIGQGCLSPPVFTVLDTEVGQDMMFTVTLMTNTDTKSISEDRTPTNQTKSNKRRQTGIERQT